MNHDFLIGSAQLNQAFESKNSSGVGGNGGSSVTRRSFIKRTGGATVAAFVCWNLANQQLNAQNFGEGALPCSARRTWNGKDSISLPFQDLRDGVKEDIDNSKQSIEAMLLAAWEASPAEWTPLGWLINQPTETKEKIKKWYNDKAWPKLEEKLDSVVDSVLVSKTATFKGKAEQNGLNLSTPVIIGPGNVGGGSVAVDLEIDGIGLKGTITSKLYVVEMKDTVVKCGFDEPNGSTSTEVACEGGSEVVADIAYFKAEISFSGTLFVYAISTAPLDDEDSKTVSITVHYP